MAQTFVAQLQRFADLTTDKLELVFKQSAQDMFSEAQTPKAMGGNMPVDSGTLRNSFVSALNGQGGTKGPDAYVTVSYTHLTLPTIHVECRSRWSPYH